MKPTRRRAFLGIRPGSSCRRLHRFGPGSNRKRLWNCWSHSAFFGITTTRSIMYSAQEWKVQFTDVKLYCKKCKRTKILTGMGRVCSRRACPSLHRRSSPSCSSRSESLLYCVRKAKNEQYILKCGENHNFKTRSRVFMKLKWTKAEVCGRRHRRN